MEEHNHFFGEEYNQDDETSNSSVADLPENLRFDSSFSEETQSDTASTTSNFMIYTQEVEPVSLPADVVSDEELADLISAHILEIRRDGAIENVIFGYNKVIAHDCEHRLLFKHRLYDTSIGTGHFVTLEYDARVRSGVPGIPWSEFKFQRITHEFYESKQELLACKECINNSPAFLQRSALKSFCLFSTKEEVKSMSKLLAMNVSEMETCLQMDTQVQGEKDFTYLLNLINATGLKALFPPRMYDLLATCVKCSTEIKKAARYGARNFKPQDIDEVSNFEEYLTNSPYYEDVLTKYQETYFRFALSLKAHTGPHAFADRVVLPFKSD